jgi:predicted MFS family arabinose efflux permease
METTESPSEVPPRLRVFAIAGVTSVQVMATMAVVIPASIAPEITREFGFPSSYVGYQVSLAYVGAILMSLAAGLVVRRFGAIRTNQIAALVLFVSMMTFAIPHLVPMVIGSLGFGIAYGITNPAASHVMMKIASPTNRNLIFSIKQTGQPLGGVLAGLMAPPIAVAFGWQWSLVAGALLALITMILIQPLRAPLDSDRDPTTRFRGAVFKDVRYMLGYPRLRLLAFAALSFSAVQIALMAYAVTMLVEDLAYTLVAAGAGLAALQVAGVIGRLGWGVAADRSGNGGMTLVVVAVISIIAALVTATLTASSPTWLVLGTIVVFGFTAVGWNGVFMAEIARLAPDGMIGSATGGVLVAVFFGVMIGPLIFNGILNVYESYTVSFAVMSVVSGIGILAILRLMMLDQRKDT